MMPTDVAALVEAVRSGDADALRTLLAGDPSIASARAEGVDSPLLTALYHGRRDLADLLMAHGREPDACEAAALGATERLRTVLDAEPAAFARVSNDGWTPLHLAAFFGQVEAIRTLLERGADPNAFSTNAMRNTPLHAGLAGPLGLEGARLLVHAGADVGALQSGGYTPLHTAASRGAIDHIDLLLDHGARVDAAAEDGRRPADLARERGHDAAVQHLRARGSAWTPPPAIDGVAAGP
jgi:ankyrin repeat protein